MRSVVNININNDSSNNVIIIRKLRINNGQGRGLYLRCSYPRNDIT